MVRCTSFWRCSSEQMRDFKEWCDSDTFTDLTGGTGETGGASLTRSCIAETKALSFAVLARNKQSAYLIVFGVEVVYR